MPPLPSPVLSGTGTPPIISVSLGTAEDLATAIPYRPDLPTGHYARHFAGLAQGGGAAAEAKMGNDEGDEGYAVSETGTTRQSSSGAGGRGSAIGPKRREQNRLAQAAFRERKKQSQQAIQEELEELRANCDKFKEASQRLQRELDAARTVLEEIGGEEALARAAKLATKNPRMGGSSTRGRSAASASTPRVTSSKAVDAIEVDSSSSSVRRSTRGGHSMQYQSVHTSDPPPIGGLVGFTAEQDGISVLDSGGRAKRRR